MQRRWVRRLSPRVFVVALCSVAMVVTAVAVSQADPRSGRAVSVAMLSGGDAASLPGADMALPGPTAIPEAAPESPPPADPSTTTTGAKGTSESTARAATVTAKPQPKPCPTNGSPDRPCGPPCPHPGSANSATACPPPCAQPAAPPAGATPVASNGTVVEPARPACPPPPPPTCRQYDIRTGTSQPCPPPCPPSDPAGNSSSCPQPCPALATADGKPAPCPPPPPCAYPTEPNGGTGATQPQLMIYCPPPCYDTPNSAGTSCPPPPPPPCEHDASCPEPCYYAQPAPASTTTIAEPVPPSEPCPPPPPPCPSAMPTDQSCTPPCSYEPAAGGPAAGAFAPCASGVTGRVTAGPTCPVERPDEPCADKPVETTLRLLRKDGSVAATEKSFSDGSFRMIVAPGSYRLVADWPSRIGGCGPVEVTVEYGRFTYAEVSCDTGIR
ncbi:MAG TPA: hypothetical protein VF180_10485 [Acidimicrobiia bacterium]